MNTGHLPKVALIAGPTASGKSAAALALAERRDGVVINADSAQVYRDLRVLSARPSRADEGRAPHALFGHVDGAAAYSAADWAAQARAAIDAALAADKLPILVGGTGLYLRTLLDGIAPVPPIDPAIRAEVRSLPVAAAHRRLADADPAAAARLNPADTTRVARALEVVVATGRPIADWQSDRVGGIAGTIDLAPVILMPERSWLATRCDARFATMLEKGAVAEVAALVARTDVAPAAPVRRAIGVAEIADWLAGRTARADAVARATAATRRYAKRQFTWFRNQPPAGWARLETNDTVTIVTEIEIKLLK